MRACLVLIFGIFLFGCASIRPISLDAKLEGTNESIVFFKIHPSNVYITLMRGFFNSHGVFIIGPHGGVGGVASNGYVGFKIKAGETYGLTGIRVIHSAIHGSNYSACADGPTIVFMAPYGKVIYISDLDYSKAFGAIDVVKKKDFDSAKKFVDSFYPNLAGRLQDSPYLSRYCIDLDDI